MITEAPSDPIAAVTHPDPYPYYEQLVASDPIARDERLGLWVACRADAVTDVLASDLCRVRPLAEPVPKALLGSTAGLIFGHLVRMNDGAKHAWIKPAVKATASGLADRVDDHAHRWARHLAAEIEPEADPARVADFAFRLSVYTLANLLGVAPGRLSQTATWVGDFVRCIAPGATAPTLERGDAAARHLMEAFRGLVVDQRTVDDAVLGGLARAMAQSDSDDRDAVAANGIGFLSQAYEATAGLIGNTLVALGRHQIGGEGHHRLEGIVAEVARHDPPAQNTRRFLAKDGVVAGQAMKAGDAVLVVLAAANRDPRANPEPARFDAARPSPRSFTFGLGPHACPGEVIAVAIAAAGVEELLARGLHPTRLVAGLSYRPSANTRIPLFSPAR